VASVLGYVEILLQDLHEPTQRDCLLRIRGEGERVQRTLRSLLDLARPSGRRWERVDVGGVVEDTLALVASHPEMKAIRLDWTPTGGGSPIWADRDQIRQVILNLMINALDAMGGQGRLRVRVGMVPGLPEEELLVPPPRRKGEPTDADFTPLRRVLSLPVAPQAGPFAFVRVEDEGPGIAPEDFDRLFEPFFTTKDPGKGTGLGLTVCLGIVESYGGRIQVTSQPGQGSCFTVFFPAGGMEEGPP
jgi:hypothetical protein